MKNNYFLILVVLLLISIASIINYYDSTDTNIILLTGDFCNDFQTIFPGCWCMSENRFIHDFNVNISNEIIAINLIDHYYKSINETCSNPECFNLGNGFYNCFCYEHVGTLRSNGEYYRTECGV